MVFTRYQISPVESDCFYAMLTDAMLMNEVGPKALEIKLRENGIDDISYKRISEYRNGMHTPTFEKARALMKILGYELDDESLLKALEKNRSKMKADKEDLYSESNYKTLKLTAVVQLRHLIPGKTAVECENILKQRIIDLCGSSRKTSLYIEGLIAKDLQTSVVKKEDFIKNENENDRDAQ